VAALSARLSCLKIGPRVISSRVCVCRSAFFCFCNDERPKVKAAHPNYAVGDIAKELGRRWETCSNKAKYEALAAKDKARYEQVRHIYLLPLLEFSVILLQPVTGHLQLQEICWNFVYTPGTIFSFIVALIILPVSTCAADWSELPPHFDDTQ